MRWDRLFADLEARFEELGDAEEAAERADRARVAVGAVHATARLAGAVGGSVRVRLAGGPSIGGSLRSVGPDWLLVTEAQGRDCMVALAAITAVEGLTAATGREPNGLGVRFDLRRALRGAGRTGRPTRSVPDPSPR